MWFYFGSEAERPPVDNQLIYLLSILHQVELEENDDRGEIATRN